MKTIDCVDCGESVPYGRLSCPACGALLAAVAGANRPPMRAVAAEPEPESEPDPETAREPEPHPAAVAAEPEPEPEPMVAAHAESPAEDPPTPEPEPEVRADVKPVADDAPEPEPVAAPPTEPDPEPEPIAAAVAVEAAVGVDPTADPPAAEPAPVVWPPAGTPEPVLAPRPYRHREPIAADGVRSPTAPPPGAYLAPAFSLSAAAAGAPSWPPVGVGGGAVATSGFSGLATRAEATDVPGEDAAAAHVVTPERYVEIAGWFVVVGAAMSVLGFLLPWSRVVIGASADGGYFGTWGLASPTHLLVLIGLLVVLGLGIVPTAVPDWLRSGVLGLATGGLVIGLGWPYLAGPLGADVGVTVAALGGLALAIGGVLASWATRHAAADPAV